MHVLVHFVLLTSLKRQLLVVSIQSCFNTSRFDTSFFI